MPQESLKKLRDKIDEVEKLEAEILQLYTALGGDEVASQAIQNLNDKRIAKRREYMFFLATLQEVYCKNDLNLLLKNEQPK